MLSLQNLFAQYKQIDSLKELLQANKKTDTLQVKRLNALGFLQRNSSIQEAQKYGERALALSDSLKYEEGMAESYGLLGLLYYREGLHELAIAHHLKSLALYEKLGIKKYAAYRYNDLANAYIEQEFYEKAHEFYQKSIAIKQEIRDIDGVATTLKNIANLHIKQKNYEEALKYALKALPLADSVKNYKTKADLLTFIGEVYLAQNNIKTALAYFEKSLLARSQINDKFSIPRLLNNIGFVYASQKDYKKALENYTKAIAIAQSINTRVDLLKSYENITSVYVAQQDYKQAFLYEQKANLLKDTIFNVGNRERINTMQSFFDTEKHKTELDLAKKDKVIQEDKIEQQKLFLYLIVSATFLLLVIVMLQWRSMQSKKVTAQTLLVQNNEISEQRKLLEIKNKDVQSSIEYAQRIQTAILPTEQQIKETLPQSFVLFMPRDIVSGDFYWFLAKNSKIVIVAADCTGHGVPGAFMTIIGNQLLSDIIENKQITEADQILNMLQSAIRKTMKQDETGNREGMDVSLVVIDKEQKTMDFAGAKNPLIYIQNGQMHHIKGDKITIGGEVREKAKLFNKHTIDISVRTTFYLFSDGYQDQFGGKDDRKLMLPKMKELFLEIHEQDMSAQKAILESTLLQWIAEANERQIDDILLIGCTVDL